jgi:hypothetical protein
VKERTVIVCGGRDGQPAGIVSRALGAYDQKRGRIAHLVVGSVTVGHTPQGRPILSTDAEAFGWAIQQERVTSVVPAQWSLYGRPAGPKRNRRMPLLFPQVKAVLAFPGGRGTYDMVSVGLALGIPVWVLNIGETRIWWSRARSPGWTKKGIYVGE